MIRYLVTALLAGASLAAPASALEPSEAERDQRRAERRAAAAAAAAARMAEEDQRFFSSAWRIAASSEPLGRRTVSDGDYVLRNRLLPRSLVRLTADAVEPGSNKVIASAGTQLFGLNSRNAAIWCVVGRRDPGIAMRLLVADVGNRQVCLVDRDKDGDLDGHFRVSNQVRGVPNFSGYLPRELEPLAAAAYEALTPEQIEVDYFVGIRFEGIALMPARPVFSVTFGNERSRERLSDVVRPRAENPVVKIMDSEFEIVARNGEALEIEVRRPIPPQPFQVIRTIAYR